MAFAKEIASKKIEIVSKEIASKEIASKDKVKPNENYPYTLHLMLTRTENGDDDPKTRWPFPVTHIYEPMTKCECIVVMNIMASDDKSDAIQHSMLEGYFYGSEPKLEILDAPFALPYDPMRPMITRLLKLIADTALMHKLELEREELEEQLKTLVNLSAAQILAIRNRIAELDRLI